MQVAKAVEDQPGQLAGGGDGADVGSSPGTREMPRVDTSPLEFIDHRTLLALDQYAARRLATVVLQSTPSIVQRLAKLIPLHALRLEETP